MWLGPTLSGTPSTQNKTYSEFLLWLSGNESNQHHEDAVQSLASPSGLTIQRCCCRELWYRSQDAAWISSCCGCGVGLQLLLFQPLAWERPLCCGCSPKEQKAKPKQPNQTRLTQSTTWHL